MNTTSWASRESHSFGNAATAALAWSAMTCVYLLIVMLMSLWRMIIWATFG